RRKARGAGGKIEYTLRALAPDGLWIEKQEIRVHAGSDGTAVPDAEYFRGLGRDPADGFLQRHQLALPDPVAEQMQAEPRIAQERQVRARIGQRNHAVRVEHHAPDR